MVNKGLLNVPDFVKIGLMAVIALVITKWALSTTGMSAYEKYL